MLRADESGITISCAALKALLAFAAREDPAERLDCIAVRVFRREVIARASDGNSSLTIRGEADGAPDGAWDVVLPFWRAAKKSLGAADKLRIEPHGATLRDATVMVQSEHGEEWEPATNLQFPWDAARVQREFPWAAVGDFEAQPVEHAPVVQLDAELFARIALVQKAAGVRSCEVAMGATAVDPIVVTVGGVATVVAMPCTSATTAPERCGDMVELQVALDVSGEEPTAEEKPKRGRKPRK